MNSDATEAALGLLGLSPLNAPLPIVPQKRKQASTPLAVSPVDPPASSDAISCICGFVYDDGFSIACDDCSRWCHAACFDIIEGEVPEEWRCWVCVPRPVDRERAVKLQKARQKQIKDAHQEKHRRRTSPGVERKPRRASAAAIEGSNSKRKRRSSVTAPPATEDELVDIVEPWTLSYVPITKDIIVNPETQQKLRRQAQHWRGVTALHSTGASLTPHGINPIRVAETPPAQTTIHALPDSSFSHPTLSSNTNPSVRPPSYALHTTTPISSSKLIAPYTSTITPSSAYLSDPLNAYAHLGMPKPFVHLFGPPLDVTLDSRITGDQSRFARSGCRPNAVLRPVLCSQSKESHAVGAGEDETLSFGVFALRDLKANEEVVLGWEWDDGNAVHSLPALIESPHMFPPSQLDHMRAQMTSILHALSSTFTTCACGSAAKDCALMQMAAFVDGEPMECAEKKAGEGKRKLDLGPLVGAKRGFRTREKVPLSGGMSGVEMVPSASACPGPSTWAAQSPTIERNHLSPPVLTLSPASATPTPRKRNDRKGKGKAVSNDLEAVSPLDDSDSVMPRGAPSRERVVIDPSPSSSPRTPIIINAMDVDGVEEPEEDKMPPRMRKRWLQQSAETFRDWRSPASPSGSVASVGSTSFDTESERMDVDDALSGASEEPHTPPTPLTPVLPDSRQMPPPPMPASLDPTTVSSVALARADSPFLPTTSPSANFSKLSLLSPIVSGSSALFAGAMPSHSHPRNPVASPPLPPPHPAPVNSPLQELHEHSPPKHTSPGPPPTAEGHPVAPTEEPLPPSPVPPSPSGQLPPRSPAPHRVRFSSPEILNGLPSLTSAADKLDETLPPVEEYAERQDSSMEHLSPDIDSPSLPPEVAPTEIPPPPEVTPPQGRPQSEPPAAPVKSPSPAPAPKVKISLKDFAMRKKKQREEEMAKVGASPAQTPSAQALSLTPSPKVNSMDIEAPRRVAVPVVGNGGDEHVAREDLPATPEVPVVTNGVVEPTKANSSDRALETHTSEPTNDYLREKSPIYTPSPVRSPPRYSPRVSPDVPDNVRKIQPNGYRTGAESLRAKEEVMEDVMPSGLVGVDDRVHNISFPPEPPPPPLNGHVNKVETNGAPVSAPAPSSGVPLSRRPSHEDGEIPNSTPPKPSYFPRSHTPPTQPRSFHVAPSSPSFTPASTSSVSARRPPPPPPLSRSQLPNAAAPGPAPVSRPLPSGPRALRAASQPSHVPAYSSSRSYSGSQYIPRGPSADRDRLDWDRERGWAAGPPRTRGRAGSSGWGR
ncbi:hypothetical protein BV22DRAFT_1126923 [Leucogyrophana mollusca]|uniref:Uncharacterized protein n=1 Tax=Leucogyrophana mollusca TaxID=85980 RepID=A0ACB8BT51_9AGAM|nr:hypothetical protein BV22DRAFT_1126923 [Leucogyrophana mollusca]